MIPRHSEILNLIFCRRNRQALGEIADPYTQSCARYSVNRGKIPGSLLEEMRASYRRCEPFLSTNPVAARTEDTTREAYRVLLSAWYTDTEIAKIDLNDRAAVIKALREGAERANGPRESRQQVVEEQDLPRLFAEGWRAVMPVNGSKFVVERA